MNSTLSHKIITFHDSIQTLVNQGWKKKRLAEELGIFPSILSVIINRIAPELLALQENGDLKEGHIINLLNEINNISEKKLRRNIDRYCEILNELQNSPTSIEEKNYLNDFEINTPYNKLSVLCGVYHCYYLSSFLYKVKKEPFFIGQYQDKRMWVQKGNNSGPTKLRGILYTSNNQLLTIQLKESNTVVADHFIAHFSLPPMYGHMKIMKGISLSFSNSYLPISRKIILHKVSNSKNINDIDKIETRFFDKNEVNDPIVNYLYNDTTHLELHHIPRPTFDVADLDIETKILNVDFTN